MDSEDRKRPRKLPKQDRAKETVRMVLEATDRLVRAEGIEAVSPQEVARVAGIAPGSFYQYFGSKEALLAAWEEDRFAADLAAMDQLLREIGERDFSVSDAIRKGIELAVARVRDRVACYARPSVAALVSRTEARVDQAEGLAKTLGSALARHAERKGEKLSPRDPELAMALTVKAVLMLAVASAGQHGEALERGDVARELGDMMVAYWLAQRDTGA